MRKAVVRVIIQTALSSHRGYLVSRGCKFEEMAAKNKGADQSVWMCRLILTFIVCMCLKHVLS